MKAVLCTAYGPPEVLQLRELSRPEPKPHEILIKVRATSVTMADFRLRSFTVPSAAWLPARLVLGIRKPRKPILGTELAGDVVAVGSAVTKYRPGDQVFAATLDRFGAYAQYCCLPENHPIALKPQNLSYEEAAVVPVGARTALYFLKRVGLQAGQRILIYGASGSVGTYAVQMARYFGAEVTAVCSAANMEWVRALGAKEVIDYTAPDFRQRLTSYDVVFEAVDKLSFAISESVLAPRGTYVNITNPFPAWPQLRAKLFSHKKIMMAENIIDDLAPMDTLREWLEAGIIRPVIDRQYELDEIVAAHRYVDQGHKKGNVAIRLLHED